ncbi:winged helix-turn-helix transcriptional regulator [Brevibacillus laterosporus]|nr:carbohydrate kinase [Brevibacillus laterosporus]TPG88287.1 winged helix-turn-helix transcriptional regulator [Brevibacillus laterosporus]
MDKEQKILRYIRLNPFISQQDLANKMGISRSAVAGYIATMMKQGQIKGRAYVLKEEASITCLGGANLDRKARSKQHVKLHSSNPVSISSSCGGVARNIAENLGRLGCVTSLITSVGNDKEGEWVLAETKQHGVDVSQSWMLSAEQTGTYTALLDVDGEMFVSLANMDIYEKVTTEMIAEKWTHIVASDIVLLDTNLPEEVLAYMITRCHDENITLYIDPVSSAKAMKLPDSLKGVTSILPNQEEAEILSGMKINNVEDVKTACQLIRKRGVLHVIVTMGEQGIFVSSAEHEVLLPPYPVDVVDVTGAGDAFASGLLHGVLHGEEILDACRLGLAASALTLVTEQSVSPELQPEKLYQFVKENAQ